MATGRSGKSGGGASAKYTRPITTRQRISGKLGGREDIFSDSFFVSFALKIRFKPKDNFSPLNRSFLEIHTARQSIWETDCLNMAALCPVDTSYCLVGFDLLGHRSCLSAKLTRFMSVSGDEKSPGTSLSVPVRKRLLYNAFCSVLTLGPFVIRTRGYQ